MNLYEKGQMGEDLDLAAAARFADARLVHQHLVFAQDGTKLRLL